jgi:peptidoglycan/LPS O-acetylase OafA/YrhL
MIKTGVGTRWQNIAGVVAAATVFHVIDHGKHNPAATVLILGLVTASAYGKVPLLRFRPLVYISTISYALYLCHNNLGCAIMRRLEDGGIPSIACLIIAVAFSFSMAIIITNHIEQPITAWLRKKWHSLRQDQLSLTGSPQPVELAVVFDPNFVAAAGQIVEADDFGQRNV